MSLSRPPPPRDRSSDSQDWQVVLRQSNGKVVLYHSNSNRLSVHHPIPIESNRSSPSNNRLLTINSPDHDLIHSPHHHLPRSSTSTPSPSSTSLTRNPTNDSPPDPITITRPNHSLPSSQELQLSTTKAQDTISSNPFSRFPHQRTYCPLCLQSLNFLPYPTRLSTTTSARDQIARNDPRRNTSHSSSIGSSSRSRSSRSRSSRSRSSRSSRSRGSRRRSSSRSRSSRRRRSSSTTTSTQAITTTTTTTTTTTSTTSRSTHQPPSSRRHHPQPNLNRQPSNRNATHSTSNWQLYRSILPQAAPEPQSRTVTQQSYFDLLSHSESPSISHTPIELSPTHSSSSSISSFNSLGQTNPNSFVEHESEPLGQEKRVDGYYERFFIEVMKLGRGQKGSVFLCTHTLDGNALGHYAVKKIAVGQSSPELLHVLSEVKFLESLRHRNITQYHHAWIEKAQLSRFGPKVPVLYILMDFANGGTLDDYIALRKGLGSTEALSSSKSDAQRELEKRNQQKERFRKMKTSPKIPPNAKLTDPTASAWKSVGIASKSSRIENPTKPIDRAVHLFGLEEILNVFEDTCRGLGFLHSKGILHHDLKTENVLLHWESEDAMIPTALISDFGSSISQSENWSRERTGRTGTLDWVPPESLKKDPKTGKLFEVTQKGDMWQLGLVLHFLCFFRLPYTQSDDIDLLKDEITRYPGFLLDELFYGSGDTQTRMSSSDIQQSKRSDLPRSLIKLLSDLLSLDPTSRPSCDRVLLQLEKLRQSRFTESPSPVYSKHLKRTFNSLDSPGSSSFSKETIVTREIELTHRLDSSSALVKRRRNLTSTHLHRSSSEEAHEPTNALMIIPGPNVYRSKQRSPDVDQIAEQSEKETESSKLSSLESTDSANNSSSNRSLIRFSSSQFNPLASRRLPPSRYFPLMMGCIICLKSIIYIQFIRPSPDRPGVASLPSPADSNTVPPLTRSPSQNNYDLMFLIIINTMELLICDVSFSIALTSVEAVIVGLC